MARARAIRVGDTLQTLTSFSLLAGAGLAAFYFWQWIQAGGLSGLSSLLPVPTTGALLPPIGTVTTSTTNRPGQNPTIPTGDLVVMTSQGPQTYGPSGEVPGTGQTVQELRSIGYTDDQIGQMIQSFVSNPGAYTIDLGPGPAGGAGGTW